MLKPWMFCTVEDDLEANSESIFFTDAFFLSFFLVETLILSRRTQETCPASL